MDNYEYHFSSVTEEDVAFNSKLEHLYNNDFGEGRFFQVVFSDDNETHIKFAPRTLLKVVYLKEKDDIEGLQLIKVVSGKDTERVKLSKFNLQQLKCFLDFINSIDLKGVSNRRISLADNSLNVLDLETKKKITTLLSGEEGSDIVIDLLKKGLITNQDLVNTGYRKQQLDKFRKLLYENGIQNYKVEIDKSNTKDETAWQHFFMRNQWIFGYGLDYRFQGILQKEFHASDTNAAGGDGVIADFLLGDKRFTTFVELKLPTTELFSPTQNRANTWRLSNSLIDAYSQILEQKASGQIKIETTKELLDDFNREISQRSFDSRTILIVGCWNQITSDVVGEKRIKEKTFELFRRDSRNIDIVTYDELYERAVFIVNNENNSKNI
ncbi:MAG TPA: DUF4263 domain-containing protein [Candidatus Andersenbacteria bacterium]|nr:DUF4263 domain-containing protein [Candidatus Andersenbacteria bacterium]